MTPDRWFRIKDLFHEVLELPPGQRDEFLRRECRDDPALCDEVKSLISSNDNTGGFIDRPLAALNFAREIPPTSGSLKESGMLTSDTLLQNRYLIISPLGQGGMGSVYLAKDQRLTGSFVAIKETIVTGDQFRRAFEQEARLLATLRHPALPIVTDYFFEGTGQFLVMQYIPGDDLATLLRNNNMPFSCNQVIQWGDQLLDVLDYLHGQKPPVIHRDIKPQNLKVSQQGNLILLDFGLAKGAPAATNVTAGASLPGYTPHFAPLEQIQGVGTDGRSDLYAVAATLYNLVTGTIPPDALTRIALTAGGHPDPLRSPAEIVPSIPTAFGEFLTEAMAVDRERRFANASVMRKALGQVRRITTHPQSPPSTLPAGSIAPAPRIAAPLISTVPLPPPTARVPQPAHYTSPQTSQEPRRASNLMRKIKTVAILAIVFGAAGIGLGWYLSRWFGSLSQTATTNQSALPSNAPEGNGARGSQFAPANQQEPAPANRVESASPDNRSTPPAPTESAPEPEATIQVLKTVDAGTFTFQLNECRWTGTTVVCVFRVVNRSTDREITLRNWASRAFDNFGNEYSPEKFQLANKEEGSPSVLVVSGVPTRAQASFLNVSQRANKLSLLRIGCWSENSEFVAEFRDVPISQ